MPKQPIRLLRLSEVLRRIPYSEAHIWRLEKNGHFPRRAHLGPKRVVWVESEIDDWIAECLKRRDPDYGLGTGEQWVTVIRSDLPHTR